MKNLSMDINKAFSQLQDEFPFDDFINCETLNNSYKTVIEGVVNNLSPAAKILDFGTDPSKMSKFWKKPCFLLVINFAGT